MNKSNNNVKRPAKKSKMPKTQQPRRQNGNGALNGESATEFAPVAMSNRQGTQAPRMASSTMRNGDLRVRVRHREYVSDILGSIAYAVTSFSINPGLAATFPWLSQLANLFESYRFNKLVFQYRTQAATASTGKALLSVDWDAADPAPTSKVLQLQERTKMDDAAWKNFDLPCDLADLLKFGVQRFTRSGALSANLDIKTYDVGNLLVGTQGQANTAAIGELWVEYDVELITPQNSEQAGSGLGVKIVASGSVSDTNIFGNAPTVTGSTALVTVANNTIIFNKLGTYLVDVLRTGTTLIALVLAGSASRSAISTTIDAAATSALSQIRVVVSAVGQTLILDASGDATDTASTTRVASTETAVVV